MPQLGTMQDSYSHPLYSAASAPHRLLLQITHTPSADPSSAPEVTVQPVARLTSTHTFRGMADFQVVSSTVPLLDRATPQMPDCNRPNEAEPNRAEQPLLVLPPLFSTTDVPFKYGYRAFARKDPKASISWQPAGKQTVISWADVCPQPPVDDDAAHQTVCFAVSHFRKASCIALEGRLSS